MKALITGATSGIGKAIAQEMSRRGISLILTGRNEEALLRMQETLPVHTEIIALDLRKIRHLLHCMNFAGTST